MNRLLEDVHKQTISDEDFYRIGKLIEANSGIKMPLHKKIMLQSRLRKRMVKLQIPTFRQYVDFVLQQDNKNTELIQLLNVISTNKTDFFREPVHYKMLQKRALPDLLKKKDRIKIWSAGCSSGEEVYSLAMIMEECRQKDDRLNYEIIGTDISEPMLKKAASAVYKEEDVIDIPVEMRRKYLLRNKNKRSKLVRICGNLRKKVKISYLNFMNQDYELSRDFDVIFFRNVLIYYSKPTQIQVLQNVCNHLNEGGFLFIGLSENLFGFPLPLERLGSNVYRKKTNSS